MYFVFVHWLALCALPDRKHIALCAHSRTPHRHAVSNHINSYLAVVTVSCFVRVRVPRTKSEIEANSKRKELLKNFRVKLKNLKAAELDELDYRKGERKDDEMKHCNVN